MLRVEGVRELEPELFQVALSQTLGWGDLLGLDIWKKSGAPYGDPK